MGKILVLTLNEQGDSVGIPAGINFALMSAATILLNNALVSYGDKPLAAMGIVTKVYILCSRQAMDKGEQ